MTWTACSAKVTMLIWAESLKHVSCLSEIRKKPQLQHISSLLTSVVLFNNSPIIIIMNLNPPTLFSSVSDKFSNLTHWLLSAGSRGKKARSRDKKGAWRSNGEGGREKGGGSRRTGARRQRRRGGEGGGDRGGEGGKACERKDWEEDRRGQSLQTFENNAMQSHSTGRHSVWVRARRKRPHRLQHVVFV